MKNSYDIIVVGAGHAGCEAAYAAAKLGRSVLLITMDMGKIAQMSCNPAIGGIAKGQIVREIDALGGCSGVVTDASTIQFRMLNRSKGVAMWSPRAQCDRQHYSMNWRYILENTSGLDIWQGSVTQILFNGSAISGVSTELGIIFNSQAVILTAGTFLNGRLFVGQSQSEGGRIGELSSYGLTEQLKSLGVETGRMKTGTPPRVDFRSVDKDLLLLQEGDQLPDRFSYLNILSTIQKGVPQKPCYIVHTNSAVHDILKASFHLSPLFSGAITGIGPRYCPSIEDKLRTFAGKDEHQLFLEPEGWDTNEYYLQGFSSSLPYDTQIEALRQIKGFENVRVFRPGYAVEYDYFHPTQLYHTLESKTVENLYFAGQVNGTTGYEEAGAQGLMAGINASLKVANKEPFVLKRDEAYIGVLIDDLVTKGVDEPYRMFTSRAEYRIILRQDNADIRLTPRSHEIGLASSYRMKLTEAKMKSVSSIISSLDSTTIKPETINSFLEEQKTTEIAQGKTLTSILSRPQINLTELLKNVPRGTLEFLTIFNEVFNNYSNLIKSENETGSDNEIYRNLPYSNDSCPTLNISFLDSDLSILLNSFADDVSFKNGGKEFASFVADILESVEIGIKYRGYIERERKMADKMLKLESIKIPDNFDFSKVSSLSMESRHKLERYRPKSIAHASRIPGVSPADISVLLIYFGR